MNDTRPAILITGATGGIGESVCRAAHSAGWPVSLLDLSADPLRLLAETFEVDRPGSVIYSAGDAASPANVASWVARSLSTFGSISGLVNVAGLFQSAPFTELSSEDIDLSITANLRTAIVCCKLVAEPMLESQTGSIVNIASTAGEYGAISPAAHYAAAKGGVIALTKSLARELSPHGSRVNAVSPGPIHTPGLHSGGTAKHSDIVSRTLLGRLGTPKEIARCVLFLLGEDSSFVTGHVLGVNGGSLL